MVRVVEQGMGGTKAILVQVEPTPCTNSVRSTTPAQEQSNVSTSCICTTGSNTQSDPPNPTTHDTPPTYQHILLHLQHDWARETHVRPGEVVHLIGTVRPDPELVTFWSSFLWPCQSTEHGGNDGVDERLEANEEEEEEEEEDQDLWADMPASQELQAIPIGVDQIPSEQQ